MGVLQDVLDRANGRRGAAKLRTVLADHCAHAFEHDRRRDRRLALLGWRVVRFTWRQVTRQPRYVSRALASLLRASAART
jgi:very-short-patch-repair endonuclease